MNYQSFIHMYIMVLIFVMDGETNIFCVICDQGENDANILNQIGSSRKGTGHPFNTLLRLQNVALKLRSNKESKTTTYVHHSCRIKFRDQIRASNKRELAAFDHPSSNKRICRATFSSLTLLSQRIPRERNENWSDIQSNKEITIHQYLMFQR